jgi:hypothetical protein
LAATEASELASEPVAATEPIGRWWTAPLTRRRRSCRRSDGGRVLPRHERAGN